MDVFHVGKRHGKSAHWEPIFIGTHQDPHYDDRLSWEGKMDKMTQVIFYVLQLGITNSIGIPGRNQSIMKSSNKHLLKI